MSAILAYRVSSPDPHARRTSEDLLRRMVFFPWEDARLIEARADSVYLGCVTSRDGGPVVGVDTCERGGVTCVFEGHLVRTLVACGASGAIGAERYAEAAVTAYLALGESFCSALEGPFTLALYDAEADRLIVGQGRIAHSPVYEFAGHGARAYATKLGPLVRTCVRAPQHDAEAVASYLTYGQFFGSQTPVKGVRCLPPASYSVTSAGHDERTVKTWHLGKLSAHLHDVPFEQHVDEVCDILIQAAERMTSRTGRYVAGLSGGLDSRLVTALAHRHQPTMKAWTFGTPGSADLDVAAEICRDLGMEHLTYTLEPDTIPQHAAQFASNIDTAGTLAHAHSLTRCADLRNHADIVLNGFAGEVIVGGLLVGPRVSLISSHLKARLRGRPSVHPLIEGNRDDAAIAGYITSKYGKARTLASCLVEPATPLAATTLRDVEAMAGDVPPLFRVEEWILANRAHRWTAMGMVNDRHYFSDGSLFYDYELIERSMRVPHAFRRDNRLYVAVIMRLLPHLGHVRYGNTGLPVDAAPWRPHLAAVKARIAARIGVKTRSLSTGEDMNAWTQGVNRGFHEGLAEDPRTLGRLWWDGDALLTRWREHLAGQIAFGPDLGIAGMLELFWRQWVDPITRDASTANRGAVRPSPRP